MTRELKENDHMQEVVKVSSYDYNMEQRVYIER